MVHHPFILGPKLVVLLVIVAVLVVLHGTLPPEQFKVAVVVSAFVFVGFCVGLWVLGYRLLKNPESRFAKATILSSQQRIEDGYSAPSREADVPVGARGKAVSGLRPSGIAVINGARVQVVTNGDFIPQGADIQVAAVQGARVVVIAAVPQEETA